MLSILFCSLTVIISCQTNIVFLDHSSCDVWFNVQIFDFLILQNIIFYCKKLSHDMFMLVIKSVGTDRELMFLTPFANQLTIQNHIQIQFRQFSFFLLLPSFLCQQDPQETNVSGHIIHPFLTEKIFLDIKSASV